MLPRFNARAGFQNECANSFLSQLVSQGTASSARADNQHHGTVIEIKCLRHTSKLSKLLPIDPIDVVEATMEITALFIGGTFIPEAGPDPRITVKVHDEVRPQRLKEGSLFSSPERLRSCLLREADPRGTCL